MSRRYKVLVYMCFSIGFNFMYDMHLIELYVVLFYDLLYTFFPDAVGSETKS